MKREVLDHLIGSCEILDIESDSIPFTHNIDNLDIMSKNTMGLGDDYANAEQANFFQHLQKQATLENKPLKKKKKVLKLSNFWLKV